MGCRLFSTLSHFIFFVTLIKFLWQPFCLLSSFYVHSLCSLCAPFVISLRTLCDLLRALFTLCSHALCFATGDLATGISSCFSKRSHQLVVRRTRDCTVSNALRLHRLRSRPSRLYRDLQLIGLPLPFCTDSCAIASRAVCTVFLSPSPRRVPRRARPRCPS